MGERENSFKSLHWDWKYAGDDVTSRSSEQWTFVLEDMSIYRKFIFKSNNINCYNLEFQMVGGEN